MDRLLLVFRTDAFGRDRRRVSSARRLQCASRVYHRVRCPSGDTGAVTIFSESALLSIFATSKTLEATGPLGRYRDTRRAVAGRPRGPVLRCREFRSSSHGRQTSPGMQAVQITSDDRLRLVVSVTAIASTPWSPSPRKRSVP